MDYNNQRRPEKSWNDPPMFSMEQLNKAANTVPANKRYRYPQQPVPGQMSGQMPYGNYPATTTTSNSYGYNNYNHNAPVSAMQPQYSSSSYPPYAVPNKNYASSNMIGMNTQQPPLPQNYNYSSTNQYPSSMYPPASASNVQNISTVNQQLPQTSAGYNNPSMPSPYCSLPSTGQNNVPIVSSGFNFTPGQSTINNVNPPGTPGFNLPGQQQSSYPQPVYYPRY